MSSTQQKALYLDSPCGEFVIKTKEIQKPEPGEVLVKIVATALNPADWKVPKFNPPFIEYYPFLLGADSAGVIEELGEGVTGFAKGDRVIHEADWHDRFASFQQYTVVSAEHLAKLPDNLSFEQAASIPLGLATAAIGLYADCDRPEGVKKLRPPPWEAGGEGVYKGKAVLVLGGTSSVGKNAIQLLKLSGFSKIIATASLRNTDMLKSLGATDVIDRNADLVSEAKNILSGDSLDLIYDAVGTKEVQSQALEILQPGGQLIAAALIHVDTTAHVDKHFITLFAGFRLPQNWALGKSLHSKLYDLLASGAIKPNAIEVLPNGLASVVAGLKRIENNEVNGRKLIIRPGETP